MPEVPWTVAFVGAGESTADNTSHLLDEWLPQNVNAPIIPDSIPRAQTGLKRVWDWLDEEFGSKNVDKRKPADIVAILTAIREKGDKPHLVFIPGGEDDPYLPVVKDAIKEGIPVFDLTAGLCFYTLPEAPQEEKPAPRRRGAPRTEETVTKAESPSLDALADGLLPERLADEDVIKLRWSRQTLRILFTLAGSMAADLLEALDDQDSEQGEIAPAETFPYWMDEDGKYRQRVPGRRGRKGEQAVELTQAEIDALPDA